MRNSIVVRACSVAELAGDKNLPDLLAAYGQESAIDGLGEPQAQVETYHLMEAAGLLHPLCAYLDGALVGFLLLLINTLPHYGKRVAVSESFFVEEAARHKGIGILLLKEAERHARELGAVGFLVSAPKGGRLSQVMPKIGYRETNQVFFRALA